MRWCRTFTLLAIAGLVLSALVVVPENSASAGMPSGVWTKWPTPHGLQAMRLPVQTGFNGH